MQGQAFAGDQRSAPRNYIYAAHDRMDPAMDNQRCVRDKRYKYIRNYMPERPYVQFLPYRDQMTLMQELFRYEREGLLNPVQQLWFRKSKPLEELYDTWEDPYEIRNLAGDPGYDKILEELREAHKKWKEDTRDWGLIPETELIRELWPPDGIQPETESPEVTVISREDTDRVEISLSSATTGASIGYRINHAETWEVYFQPVLIGPSDTLSALAHRIGFTPSEIVEWINK